MLCNFSGQSSTWRLFFSELWLEVCLNDYSCLFYSLGNILLFSLLTVYFRQQLTHGSSPDLVLLSVVVGHVENCMTNAKNVSNIPVSSLILSNCIAQLLLHFD